MRIMQRCLLKKGKDRRKMKATKSKCIIATALHFSSNIQSITGRRGQEYCNREGNNLGIQKILLMMIVMRTRWYAPQRRSSNSSSNT